MRDKSELLTLVPRVNSFEDLKAMLELCNKALEATENVTENLEYIQSMTREILRKAY